MPSEKYMAQRAGLDSSLPYQSVFDSPVDIEIASKVAFSEEKAT
jgi:hypothetical protein